MVRSTNNLVFSSIFPCNNKRVNERFIAACKKLGLEEWRLKPTVKEAYTSLLESPSVTKGRGPEGSKVVDVRGDGNCLFYSLMAPLLGFVPGPADKVVLEYLDTFSKCCIFLGGPHDLSQQPCECCFEQQGSSKNFQLQWKW
jgi:hypothetical protein